MKYLQNRNQFLNKKIDLKSSDIPKYIGGSKLIKETFENDITWGGSLLGRLINSAIRKFKIGVKQVQIAPLLDKLKVELDYLVSASMKGKSKETLDLLKLKGFMEQIKDECLRPSSTDVEEAEILEELLGDGSPGNPTYTVANAKSTLFNPDKPKETVETKGLVQGVIDTLNDDFPDLKEILGLQRDVILDNLSNFNDELRKYYYTLLSGDVETGGEDSSVSDSMKRFQQNFGNIIDAISADEEENKKKNPVW